MRITSHFARGDWAMLLVCVSLASCNRDGTCAGKAPAASTSQKEEVVALIRQALLDSDAQDKRVRMQSDRIPPWQARSAKHWSKQYPVSYARERLIARGRSVVPALLEITRDPSCTDLHCSAWDYLGTLDYPDYLKQLYEAGRQERLTPSQVSGVILTALPVRMQAEFLQNDKVMDWLGSQLNKNYDQIVLDLLDKLFTAEYADGGLFPGMANDHVLRWLDRIYDIDLDSWLAQNAPAALKFRREQLAKGYDPATSFELAQNISDRLLDEALVAIYPQPEDQKACRALLEAVYMSTTSAPLLRPEAKPGWEQRLRDWYRNQRASLRYDRSLMRFVPKTSRAASGAATGPSLP